ncbi:hypothetical protein ABPG75_008215 [Micractinium tetrahymenae]
MASALAAPLPYQRPSLRSCCSAAAFSGNRKRPAIARRQGKVAAASGGAAATALASQLEADLHALMAQGKELEKEELDQRVQEIKARSAEAGTNQVFGELNQGTFEALPLSGRLKQVTGPAAPLLLGGLTFGAGKPADLKLGFRPPAPYNQRRLREGVPTYSVTTAFAVEEHEGLEGSCEVAGAYTVDDGNPQRLHISFSEVTLTPRVAAAAALARWVELFSAANDEGTIDAATGMVRLRLAAPLPAWLDFVVMTEEWQLARSNWGSYVLLLRRDDPDAA